ncbi:hypothetical protein EDD16DRAFT_1516543 [Pisolithus croceorrhizus]|nr:hypothetical protein EDD16DRAFT_1516543 [Pisolithus croceorrhizus]KAI6158538.1 hypothetical protein EDD17DRAFT_1512109 [Pisolithus thermaeus]
MTDTHVEPSNSTIDELGLFDFSIRRLFTQAWTSVAVYCGHWYKPPIQMKRKHHRYSLMESETGGKFISAIQENMCRTAGLNSDCNIKKMEEKAAKGKLRQGPEHGIIQLIPRPAGTSESKESALNSLQNGNDCRGGHQKECKSGQRRQGPSQSHPTYASRCIRKCSHRQSYLRDRKNSHPGGARSISRPSSSRQATDDFEFVTRQSLLRLGSMVVQPSSSPAINHVHC